MIGRFQPKRSRKKSNGESQAGVTSKASVNRRKTPTLLGFLPALQATEYTFHSCLDLNLKNHELTKPSIKKNEPSNVQDEASSFNNRTSIRSIIDDPFFRNYNSPKAMSLSHELQIAKNAGYFENESFITECHSASPIGPTVDRIRGESPTKSQTQLCHTRIAVVGATGVGKSTFIQRALGLSTRPTSLVSSTKISIEDTKHEVSLFEIDTKFLEFVSDQEIKWSKEINGQEIPRMDSVLLLCDIKNNESLCGISTTLEKFANSLMPTVLVWRKCDKPESSHQIHADEIKQFYQPIKDSMKMTACIPYTSQICVATILRTVMENVNDQTTSSTAKIRFFESLPLNFSENLGLQKRDSKCDRHLSSLSIGRDITIFSSTVASPSSVTSFCSFDPLTQKSSSSHNDSESLISQLAPPDKHDASSTSISSMSNSETLRSSTMYQLNSIPGDSKNNFLDLNLPDANLSFHYSQEMFILQNKDEHTVSNVRNTEDDLILKQDEDHPGNNSRLGLTLDELMDRLTSQSMTRSDKNFIDIFLCLYRKFATPGELLSGILARLDMICNDSDLHVLIKAESQFRILNVFLKWISTYPGDFAGPSTSQRLNEFISSLIFEPKFASAAYEIRLQLQTRVTVDDDTGWDKFDPDFNLKKESHFETESTSACRQRFKFRSDLTNCTHSSLDEEEKEEICSLFSRIDTWARPASPTPSSHIVEDCDMEAATLVPRSLLPLSKYRYYVFMQISDDEFSNELTRIDWLMFSTIRLRGLLRHVSLSSKEKGKWKDLSQVNRMITHFNHIANWVASLVLMREKAKHRAMVLEKFINIAQKLRQLNNYNGLAAVLAGLNNCAVFRLGQTWSLIPKDVHKRFTRLMMLMGVQRSHSAYRLAWKSSYSFRIPFLPLHRRDLISAEEGSLTFIDANCEYINWKKFEILSEIILPLMRSQMMPYPNLLRSKSTKELILDCKIMIDDEELYKRSLAVESSATGSSDIRKKKFSWFQK
ncbi:putative ras guanyl-nucleotide exchange factor [Erysiphe necator]|uniref:Putative ras guanyl-nucleotide exchange factor n=1 Tax=Uncinula necator TaxID=52586 RepID=A0A0B1PG43_UNCNE|nr:putative ras guanyl-nucleotide exchange factor [Erysiphe necator]